MAQKKVFLMFLVLFGLFWALTAHTYASNGCVAPDDQGTVLYPPDCPLYPYQDHIRMVEGLPPGTTIECLGPLAQFMNQVNIPGGILGGEICTFNAFFEWELVGTGELEGFHRMIALPVDGAIHTGPRIPGEPVQEFPADLFTLGGQIVGDPDFETLRIVAGTDYGLPSPGNVKLTQLPSGDFAVDSFFDITYQIDFVGALGSKLEGMAGSTIGVVAHKTEEAKEVRVHFAVLEEDDWLRLLFPEPGDPSIKPMTPDQWDDYMNQYNDPAHLDGNEPYPDTVFLDPDLYVWPNPEDSNDVGCVMTWGDSSIPDGNYASAWRYVYEEDPDLSNSSVQVQVEAPCGIQQISIGLQDAAGNIRGWYWNVAPMGAPGGPGVLTCSPDIAGNMVRHTISIDLSKTGVMAASPQAFSYSSALGFDITKVMNFTYDENFQWLPGVTSPVPPPGQVDPKPWNYWFNLVVRPNAKAYKGYYLKWSQPPVELAEGLIHGWDEKSICPQWPIMADDWECNDVRPVTDIHWWGSFLGWKGERLPDIKPIAFHIGIWTDIPDPNPDDPDTYSQPGKLIWENYCDNWVWNYAGVDIDPRVDDPEFTVEESCFQFNQLLSEDEWFHQQPMEDGVPNVYWLSVCAIYGPDQVPQYPWGWKTRPHHFNDDAVRILDTSGQLPPAIGDRVTGAMPVELMGESWDLAFELTTNKPCPEGPSADINRDGFVDFYDFAILADQWLTCGTCP